MIPYPSWSAAERVMEDMGQGMDDWLVIRFLCVENVLKPHDDFE